ncbi:MAG: SapC family protein [Alphaproteobacteria bacterium]|nr:SapC family protein [Alphaproteobacteria bacterium]
MTDSKAQLPLFYADPQPLTADRHAKMSLPESQDYGFSRVSNAIPLTADEFWMAARSFPILFAPGASPLPVALVGLRTQQNLFVDDKGRWAEGCYMPTYVKRFPFVFMSSPGGERYVLCVDEASGRLEESAARPLYVNGKPSPVLDEALKLCADYQRRHLVTAEFGTALAREGLLIERAAQITLASGESLNLTGFSIVDEKKLDDLPNRQFLDWRRRGWLPLIYAHLVSLQSWAALVDRTVKAG